MPKYAEKPSPILRATRKAEMQALANARAEVRGQVQDTGTGFTILKRRETPIQRLLRDKRIGREELQAAEDIDTAFAALTGALFCKSPSLERRDPGYGAGEAGKTIEAVTRYKYWANLWSRRAKQGDPTLEIIIAAVVDGRPFREIETDLRLRNGSAAKAVMAGLRDYAARAGWATGAEGRRWLVSEGALFRLRPRRLLETLRGMARRWDRERAA